MIDDNEIINNAPELETAHDIDAQAQAERDSEVETDPKPKRKYGKFMLGFTALSALVIGGASGGGFVHYLLPNQSAAQSAAQNTAASQTANADIAALRAKLAGLEDKNTKLERQMSAQFKSLSAKLASAPQGSKPDNSAELKVLSKRLDALETDLETAIETAKDAALNTPVIDEDLVARLEKLQETGSPALDLSEMQARMGKVENAQIPEDAIMLLGESLEDIEARQSGIELQVQELSEAVNNIEQTPAAQAVDMIAPAPASAPAPAQPVQDLVGNFPKAALLDALANQDKKKPFLKRTLSKHIKVKNENAPAVMIGSIEDSLASGDIDTALDVFDKLPSEIRSAGRSWRQSFN